MSATRERFEKEFVKRGFNMERNDGYYVETATQDVWEGYEAATADMDELLPRVRKLLEWMPTCSPGSSGYMRRRAVEESLARMAPSSSAAGVKADLEHPGNDTGGEIANQVDELLGALRAIEHALHDDKGNYWKARKYLDDHGKYHGNLQGLAVLLEVAQVGLARYGKS